MSFNEFTVSNTQQSLSSNVIPPAKPLPCSSIRKRAREPEGSVLDLPRPFQIHVHPFAAASNIDEPYIVTPLLWTSRNGIPFSFLDLTGRLNVSVPLGRFIHVQIEDLEARFARDPTTCLVVRIGSDASLCVLERCSEGAYALCRLAAAIGLQDIRNTVEPRMRAWKVSRTWSRFQVSQDNWWSDAVVERNDVIEKSPPNQTISLSGKLAACSATPAIETEEPPNTTMSVKKVDSDHVHHGVDSFNNADQVGFDPQACFGDLIQAYLETLYLSKASLAYFIKGPLTRLRTRFETEESSEPLQHSKFLRGMLLAPSLFDHKYKDRIPAVARETRADQSGDPLLDMSTVKLAAERKRKLRKLKPGRDGLYADEGPIISRWWITEVQSLLQGEPEVHLRKRLEIMRVRESLLQLILMLEIVAVERIQGVKDGELQDRDVTSKATAKKAKKLPDIKLKLELLIDRLSIWQSIATASTPTDTSPGAGQETSREGQQAPDALKEFVTELVVPFFASRCGPAVRSLCKKLGIVQARDSPSVARRATEKVAPGQPVQRRKTTSGATTQCKVARDRAAAPGLSRSVTDSFADQIKRERSSTPSLSSASSTMRRPPSRTGSGHHQHRASVGRELDLSAIAKYNKARSQAKCNVDEELIEAIATIKRPNRSLAVKEFVDASDERRPSLMARPVAKRSASSVFIGATPKRANKHATSMLAEPDAQWCETSPVRSIDVISSTMQAIPQSVQKLPSAPIPVTGGQEIGVSTLKLLKTPSRQTSRAEEIGQTPLKDLSSNVTRLLFAAPRHAGEDEKVAPVHKRREGSGGDSGIETSSQAEAQQPLVGARLQGEDFSEDQSIYQALGWDDSNDLDE